MHRRYLCLFVVILSSLVLILSLLLVGAVYMKDTLQARMATTSFTLWLLLVGAILPQGCCQHWSFGLSPGGKRDLDSLSDTLGNLVDGFPHVETPCSVFGCAEESPFAEIYRTKGFLGSVTDRKNGHGTYKK